MYVAPWSDFAVCIILNVKCGCEITDYKQGCKINVINALTNTLMHLRITRD